MAIGYANISIIGNLGADPETRYTSDGTAVCSFRVAVTPRKARKDGEESMWFRVSAWRNKAELCQQYLKKGHRVFVAGSFSMDTYQDNRGQQRASLDIELTDVMFLTSKAAGDEPPARQGRAAAATDAMDDGDIPF